MFRRVFFNVVTYTQVIKKKERRKEKREREKGKKGEADGYNITFSQLLDFFFFFKKK